jgi:hypothetical protein
MFNKSCRNKTAIRNITKNIKHLAQRPASNPIRSGSRNVQSGQQVAPRFARGFVFHGSEASSLAKADGENKTVPAPAGTGSLG